MYNKLNGLLHKRGAVKNMQNFSVLIKPASSLCNMRCKYCFYADVSDMREVRSYGIMSKETAEKLIDRVYEACPSGNVFFSFQGGEPTLAGLDFFENFSLYAHKNKPQGVKISYSIQTNGVEVDEKWCEYFAKYSYLVGLSLDGDRAVQNECRIKADGMGSYEVVSNAAKMLKAHKVDFNILSVITAYSAKYAKEMFNYWKRRNFEYVQPIPCLAPLDGDADEYSLTPQLFEKFFTELYDVWEQSFRKCHYIGVRQFDNLVRMASGQQPEMCGMKGFCQAQYVVEANGGVYPCDFYVLDEYLCGNIFENSFSEIFESENMQKFLKRDDLSSRCLDCPAVKICGGGCRRFRSVYFGEDCYCAYREFLLKCYPKMRALAFELFGRK